MFFHPVQNIPEEMKVRWLVVSGLYRVRHVNGFVVEITQAVILETGLCPPS